MLEDLANKEADKFATFWKEFGRVLKEGAAEDGANRERITKLLRFASTKQGSDEQTVSLAEYVGRMKDGQEAIYYITGDGFAATRNSPHLEIFRKLDVEVLLMYDRVDEWVASMLTEFEGKPLRSVAKGGLDLGKLAEQVVKPDEITAETEYKPLVERIQRVLAARAREVRVTHRLTDSPACLVTDEHAMSTHLERMLKAAGQNVPVTLPVLEINPQHPIVQRLKDEADEDRFADWSQILFDQALLAEGGALDDPATFVKRLNKLTLTLAGGPASKIWTP